MRISASATILLCLILFSGVVFASDESETESTPETLGEIIIVIGNIRNSDGDIRAALFGSTEGFPGESESAFSKIMVPSEINEVQITFTDIPFGNYAVIALHDENSNEKMDKNFFGKPTEGYCISNGVRGGMSGPPGFEDAEFTLDSETMTVTLEMEY